MEKTFTIKNIIDKDKALEVEWSDGKKSDFNYIWLRDNCPSDIHPTARERQFNLKDITKNIRPESYHLENIQTYYLF